MDSSHIYLYAEALQCGQFSHLSALQCRKFSHLSVWKSIALQSSNMHLYAEVLQMRTDLTLICMQTHYNVDNSHINLYAEALQCGQFLHLPVC